MDDQENPRKNCVRYKLSLHKTTSYVVRKLIISDYSCGISAAGI